MFDFWIVNTILWLTMLHQFFWSLMISNRFHTDYCRSTSLYKRHQFNIEFIITFPKVLSSKKMSFGFDWTLQYVSVCHAFQLLDLLNSEMTWVLCLKRKRVHRKAEIRLGKDSKGPANDLVDGKEFLFMHLIRTACRLLFQALYQKCKDMASSNRVPVLRRFVVAFIDARVDLSTAPTTKRFHNLKLILPVTISLMLSNADVWVSKKFILQFNPWKLFY